MKILLLLMLMALFSAFFAWLFSVLWAAVPVAVFGWPALSFWQSWALSILIGLVTGGRGRS